MIFVNLVNYILRCAGMYKKGHRHITKSDILQTKCILRCSGVVGGDREEDVLPVIEQPEIDQAKLQYLWQCLNEKSISSFETRIFFFQIVASEAWAWPWLRLHRSLQIPVTATLFEYLSRNSNKNHESAQNCHYRLLPDPDCHPAFPRVLPFIFNVFSGSSNWPTFARKIWPEWKFQFSSMCISSLPPVMIWMWHKLPHVCQEYLAGMKISSSQCAFPLSLQFPRVIWMWHKCETCYFLAKYIFLEKA